MSPGGDIRAWQRRSTGVGEEPEADRRGSAATATASSTLAVGLLTRRMPWPCAASRRSAREARLAPSAAPPRTATHPRCGEFAAGGRSAGGRPVAVEITTPLPYLEVGFRFRVLGDELGDGGRFRVHEPADRPAATTRGCADPEGAAPPTNRHPRLDRSGELRAQYPVTPPVAAPLRAPADHAESRSPRLNPKRPA